MPPLRLYYFSHPGLSMNCTDALSIVIWPGNCIKIGDTRSFGGILQQQPHLSPALPSLTKSTCSTTDRCALLLMPNNTARHRQTRDSPRSHGWTSLHQFTLRVTLFDDRWKDSTVSPQTARITASVITPAVSQRRRANFKPNTRRIGRPQINRTSVVQR